MHHTALLAALGVSILGLSAVSPAQAVPGYSTGTPVTGNATGSYYGNALANPGYARKGRWSIEEVKTGYAQSMRQLHKDMLARQQSDGGRLSDEHRVMFQRRLERINDFHRRQLHNAT
jgi:hypothetical protein